MAYRLTKIYTRTGDQGLTRLADGEELAKNATRITALGDVDELNCVLGLILTHIMPPDIKQCLSDIQQLLFELGAELAVAGSQRLHNQDVEQLEKQLDRLNEQLPPLTEFILPGGVAVSAHCHLARAVCRRSERALVALMQQEPINPISLRFLNRLSDLLFVVARFLQTQETQQAEVLWQPRANSAPIF